MDVSVLVCLVPEATFLSTSIDYLVATGLLVPESPPSRVRLYQNYRGGVTRKNARPRGGYLAGEAYETAY